MSLRWSSYIVPKPPKRGGAAKLQFPSKIALRLKKVCYKVSCENCQRQSCKAFIGLANHAKMIDGATPSTWNLESNWPRWSEITDYLSIFAHSASTITPSEKSSINTNRKSTTRFPISPRWTSCLRSTRSNFVTWRTRTHFADSSFAVARPAAWNSLLPYVRNTDSHSAFCHLLKTNLFTVSDWLNCNTSDYISLYVVCIHST